ncbi:MAG: hypothetical protein Q8O00_04700 [Holophaga sp.]|nr:hypothetical protein [Holophaga sp.]
MTLIPEAPSRCALTGIHFRWSVPGGLPSEALAPWAVFFLNGIGLDLEGFQDALEAPGLASSKFLYRHGYHVALTVPGFEDLKDRVPGSVLSMADQGCQVAAFMEHFLAEHPAQKIILYGFSFGSDLAVDVLLNLGTRFPLVRVILAEMNVNSHSCFITSRITSSFTAAKRQGPTRNQEAYKGFVSLVVKANVEGRISASLMQEMAFYFRTIARKDWDQLAQSAEEASENPEIRVARLLGATVDFPDTQFELVFSDVQDLRIFQRRLETWGGKLGKIRVFDSTSHEHFHHMRPAGVVENLGGWLQCVAESPRDSS